MDSKLYRETVEGMSVEDFVSCFYHGNYQYFVAANASLFNKLKEKFCKDCTFDDDVEAWLK